MSKKIYVVTMENDELEPVEIGYASNQDIANKMIEKASSTDGFEYNTYNSYQATVDYMEINDELICFEEKSSEENKELWFILSNYSEAEDINVCKIYGTRNEAFNKMKAMVFEQVLELGENRYYEIEIDSSKMVAHIEYSDSHENFRVVNVSDVYSINNDDTENKNLIDSLPDDISWDNNEVHEKLFPFSTLDEIEVELLAIEETIGGYFSNGRIERGELPSGWYAYDFREGDDGDFCALEPEILVNHGGTFVTKKEISFGEKGFLELGKDFEYSFC